MRDGSSVRDVEINVARVHRHDLLISLPGTRSARPVPIEANEQIMG